MIYEEMTEEELEKIKADQYEIIENAVTLVRKVSWELIKRKFENYEEDEECNIT